MKQVDLLEVGHDLIVKMGYFDWMVRNENLGGLNFVGLFVAD